MRSKVTSSVDQAITWASACRSCSPAGDFMSSSRAHRTMPFTKAETSSAPSSSAKSAEQQQSMELLGWR